MTPEGIPDPCPQGGTLARILSDFSHPLLVDAIERNCIDFFMEYGRGPGCETHEDGDVTWFVSGLPDPLFNGVMTARLAPDRIDGRIDELMAIFKARGLPLEWTVGSSTVPQDLGTHLRAKGLTNLLVVPGMAIDLATLADEPLPRGLTVRPAERREDVEACVRIVAKTFRIEDALVPRLVDLELGMPEDHRENAAIYLGRLHGKPAATSMLFGSAGVAGLYFVGTLPEARRRGLARTMTMWALKEGRDRGYRVGALQATEMGLPVYRRLGFQEHSRFEIYT